MVALGSSDDGMSLCQYMAAVGHSHLMSGLLKLPTPTVKETRSPGQSHWPCSTLSITGDGFSQGQSVTCPAPLAVSSH